MFGDPEVERLEATPFLFQAKFRMADSWEVDYNLTHRRKLSGRTEPSAEQPKSFFLPRREPGPMPLPPAEIQWRTDQVMFGRAKRTQGTAHG